jgi:hypothetical protein
MSLKRNLSDSKLTIGSWIALGHSAPEILDINKKYSENYRVLNKLTDHDLTDHDAMRILS